MRHAREQDRLGELRAQWDDVYHTWARAYGARWATELSPAEQERAIRRKRAVLDALSAPPGATLPTVGEWTRMLLEWSLAATPFVELQHGPVGVAGWSATAQADYEREAAERGRPVCRGEGACGPMGWCAVGCGEEEAAVVQALEVVA